MIIIITKAEISQIVSAPFGATRDGHGSLTSPVKGGDIAFGCNPAEYDWQRAWADDNAFARPANSKHNSLPSAMHETISYTKCERTSVCFITRTRPLIALRSGAPSWPGAGSPVPCRYSHGCQLKCTCVLRRAELSPFLVTPPNMTGNVHGSMTSTHLCALPTKSTLPHRRHN